MCQPAAAGEDPDRYFMLHYSLIHSFCALCYY